MGFFRQEYWSGLAFPSPGDLPDPGSNPHLLCLLHWRRILYLLNHWVKFYGFTNAKHHVSTVVFTSLSKAVVLLLPGTSLVAQMVKSLPAMWETCIWFLSWEDPLEKGMVIHSNVLAWRIPRSEEPGAWQVTVHELWELDVTEWLTHTRSSNFFILVCST